MTNPVKGEVTFEALGKSWRFKLGNAALVELEAHFKKNIAAVLAMFQDADAHQMTLMQAVILAGLRRYHPEVTKETASDVIDYLGYDSVVEILKSSVNTALPSAKEGENPT